MSKERKLLPLSVRDSIGQQLLTLATRYQSGELSHFECAEQASDIAGRAFAQLTHKAQIAYLRRRF